MELAKYKHRKVVLVDEADNELGQAGLIEAHREPGKRHRAFSLVLYRRVLGKVELLLQKRAEEKPVFAHYWTNTCCYNMAPGEKYLLRARERVREEMGVELGQTKLKKLYQFSYYASDKDGWCENELDQVIVGEWSGEVVPEPEEAEDYTWMEWGVLRKDICARKEVYAPWFRMMVEDGRLEEGLSGSA